jgi:membrane protein YqaA with SNARE-associated domain
VLLDSLHLSREFFISLGPLGVFAVAFLEFFLLPVPPDLVLIPLTVVSPELGPVYAVLATAGSVSAGGIGYAFGRRGGQRVLASRFSSDRVEQAEKYVKQYGFAVLCIGAFAPIPEGYELLSIAAGVFGLRPRSYLLASVMGRGGRYVLEIGLAIVTGEAARLLTEVELYSVIGVFSVVVIGAYVLRHLWLPERWVAR